MQSIPLLALFGKTEAANAQVSPNGKWLGWLARSDGVLNLWVAALPLSPRNANDSNENTIPGARQLTSASDGRDIAFSWRFTSDDSRIVYIRESLHGSELYHLYALDITSSNTAAPPVAEGRNLLASRPELTCAVGFVGGLQCGCFETTQILSSWLRAVGRFCGTCQG